MARSVANVVVASDTFQTLVDRTNEIAHLVSNDVVTVSANTVGDTATGNTTIIGSVVATTLVANGALRGGNLTTTGTLGVSSALTVSNTTTTDTLTVTGDAGITGNTTITGAATVGGNAEVTGIVVAANLVGETIRGGNSTVANTLTVISDAAFTGNAAVTGTVNTAALGVSGDASVTGNTTVTGNVNAAALNVSGVVNTVTLSVTGDAGVTGNTTVTGNVNAAAINITGKVNAATVETSGGIVVGGNTTVTGNVNAASINITGVVNTANLAVTGNAHITGTINPGTNTTVQGLTITAGVVANGSLGSASQVLRTDGANVYWANPVLATDSGYVADITAGNGLVRTGNTLNYTLSVVANNGLLANSTGVFVVANSGIIANSTGVFVNATSVAVGTLPAVRGGTGIGTYVANNYLRAATTSTLEQRTPAQVLGDIGAAADIHVHDADEITTGTLATDRLGSGTANTSTYLRGDQTWAVVDPVTDLTTSANTISRTVLSSTGTDAVLPAANSTQAGVLTSADKSKLDGIEALAEVNDPTNLGTSANTISRTVTSSTGTSVVLPAANSTQAGVMISTDKTKLDTVESGAQVNLPTDLTTSANTTTRTVLSSTGTDVILPAANSTQAGVMVSTDKTKLDGIAPGAQVGTVTSVASGNGMIGGPVTGTGTLRVLANSGIIANTSGVFVNATSIAVGTMPTARLGSGTANTITYLRGDQTWQTLPPTNLGTTANTTTRTVTSSTGASVVLPVANSTQAGVLTSTDKSKLDGIEALAEVNDPTNLGTSANTISRTVTSSTGTSVVLPAANSTQAGVMVSTDKTKLDGIEALAEVNDPTDLGTSANTISRTITSSTGADVVIPAANSTQAGVMVSADKTKLDSLTTWVEKTTTYTAVNGDKLLVDTTGGAFTITLPASPSIGHNVVIADGAGVCGSNNVTVARNGENILGSADNLVIDVNNAAVDLVYYNASRGWILVQR